MSGLSVAAPEMPTRGEAADQHSGGEAEEAESNSTRGAADVSERAPLHSAGGALNGLTQSQLQSSSQSQQHSSAVCSARGKANGSRSAQTRVRGRSALSPATAPRGSVRPQTASAVSRLPKASKVRVRATVQAQAQATAALHALTANTARSENSRPQATTAGTDCLQFLCVHGCVCCVCIACVHACMSARYLYVFLCYVMSQTVVYHFKNALDVFSLLADGRVPSSGIAAHSARLQSKAARAPPPPARASAGPLQSAQSVPPDTLRQREAPASIPAAAPEPNQTRPHTTQPPSSVPVVHHRSARGVGVGVSSEEAVLRVLEEAKERNRALRRLNEQNMQRVVQPRGPILPQRSSKELTVPQEFNFAFPRSRNRTHSSASQSATPSPRAPSPSPSPFWRSSSAKRVNATATAAAAAATPRLSASAAAPPWATSTPQHRRDDVSSTPRVRPVTAPRLPRSRTAPAFPLSTPASSQSQHAKAKATAPRSVMRSRPSLTQPVSPNFSSKSRARTHRAALSTAEREEMEMRSFQPFKAHKVNPAMLEGCGDLGVPRVMKAPCTEFAVRSYLTFA